MYVVEDLALLVCVEDLDFSSNSHENMQQVKDIFQGHIIFYHHSGLFLLPGEGYDQNSLA